MTDLDVRFGTAEFPSRVDAWERMFSPKSRQKLDEESSKRLSQLMEAAAGLEIVSKVYSVVPILWLIDPHGDVLFSLEELVEKEGGDFVAPRIRGAPRDEAYHRLGHPSLVAGGPGRIGGELVFDDGALPKEWVLTNASGRYGQLSGRTDIHLRNVALEFRKFGIVLKHNFQPEEP